MLIQRISISALISVAVLCGSYTAQAVHTHRSAIAYLLTLSEEQEAKRIQMILDIANQRQINTSFFEQWFSHPASIRHPEIIDHKIEEPGWDRIIAQYVLSQAHWADHTQWMEYLLKRGTVDTELVTFAFSEPHWKKHPEYFAELILSGSADHSAILFALSQPHWASHPELVELFLRKGTTDVTSLAGMLYQRHWQYHPDLRRILNGARPTGAGLRKAFAEGATFLDSCAMALMRR